MEIRFFCSAFRQHREGQPPACGALSSPRVAAPEEEIEVNRARRLHLERVVLIIRLRLAGRFPKEIARRTGLSPRWVRYLLRLL